MSNTLVKTTPVGFVAWFRAANGSVSEQPALTPMAQPGEGLAVAICTYKRPESLKRFMDSLRAQSRLPDELLVVDASPDGATESMVREYPDLHCLAGSVWYARVNGELAGLTRQRNVAAVHAGRDLIVYFDDDMVLEKECLAEMEKVHRALQADVVGVGAAIVNAHRSPSARWKLRKVLHVIPSLEPGRYYRSGISTPWAFHGPTEELLEGDWINGGAMMWRTVVVRRLQFNPLFQGYSNGEDLDFSLRARSMGRILLAGKAHAHHLPDPHGRPDAMRHAYMGHRNSYMIHRTCLAHRTRWDAVRFFYGVLVDASVKCFILLRREGRKEKWESLKGSLRFLRDVPRISSAGIAK
jgi:GT2 family glycosyltransferase